MAVVNTIITMPLLNPQDMIANYSCTCVGGWTGMNCKTNIDDCTPNPCLNGGNCTVSEAHTAGAHCDYY